MKCRLIVVAAPSGAGKSSFVERIAKEDSRLRDVVTCTTRAQRDGESQGHPYHFLSMEDFKAKIEKNYFVEWAQVHTNLYGTSFKELETAWIQGKCCIMDIDIQGVRTFKAKFPEDVKTVFILPPSIDELRRRVLNRDGGKTQDLEVRMKNAEMEILEAPGFDFQLVNDDFETSYAQFKKIVEELLT